MHDTDYTTLIQGTVPGSFPLSDMVTVRLLGSETQKIADYLDRQRISYVLDDGILSFSIQVKIETAPEFTCTLGYQRVSKGVLDLIEFKMFKEPVISLVDTAKAETHIAAYIQELGAEEIPRDQIMRVARGCSLVYSLQFSLKDLKRYEYRSLTTGLPGYSDVSVSDQSIEQVVSCFIKNIKKQAPKTLLRGLMGDYCIKLKDHYTNFSNLFFSRINQQSVTIRDTVYLEIAGLTDLKKRPCELECFSSPDFLHKNTAIDILLSEKSNDPRKNLGGDKATVPWVIGNFFSKPASDKERIITNGFRMLNKANSHQILYLDGNERLSICRLLSINRLDINPADFQRGMKYVEDHLDDNLQSQIFRDMVEILKNQLKASFTSKADNSDVDEYVCKISLS